MLENDGAVDVPDEENMISAENFKDLVYWQQEVIQDLETRIFNLTEREKTKDRYIVQMEAKLEQADERRERDMSAIAHQRAKVAKLAKDVQAAEAYVQELEAKVATKEEQLHRLSAGSSASCHRRSSVPILRPHVHQSRVKPEALHTVGESDAAAVPSSSASERKGDNFLDDSEGSKDDGVGDGNMTIGAGSNPLSSQMVNDDITQMVNMLDAQSLQIQELSETVDGLRDQLQAAEDENKQQATIILRLEKINKDLSCLLEGSREMPSLAEEVERSSDAVSPLHPMDLVRPPQAADEDHVVMETSSLAGTVLTNKENLAVRVAELERDLEAKCQELAAERARLKELEGSNLVCEEKQADLAWTSTLLEEVTLRCEAIEAENTVQAAIILDLENRIALKDDEAKLQMAKYLTDTKDLQSQVDELRTEQCNTMSQVAIAPSDEPTQANDAASPDFSEDVEALKEALRTATDEIHIRSEDQARLEASVLHLQEEITANKNLYDAMLRDRLKEAKVIHDDWKMTKKSLEQMQSKLKASVEREEILEKDVVNHKQAYAALQGEMECEVQDLKDELEFRTAAIRDAIDEKDGISRRLGAVNGHVKLLETEMKLHDARAALVNLDQGEQEGSSSKKLRAAWKHIVRLERERAATTAGAEYMAAEVCRLVERLHQERERRRVAGQRSVIARFASCPCQAKSRAIQVDLSAKISELELALADEIKRAGFIERRLETVDRERASLLRRLPPDGEPLVATTKRPKRRKAIWLPCISGGGHM